VRSISAPAAKDAGRALFPLGQQADEPRSTAPRGDFETHGGSFPARRNAPPLPE
jgi:hypothetical protein